MKLNTICAAVKAPGGYVILKAVLTPQIAEADLPINAIIWTGGGQAVPNSKLKWRVPKTVAKKYSITATVGNTSYTMLSFVVWAEATEGWFSTTQFPNYKSPNNNQIPTYPDGLGGPEPDGSFASWCEMRFTIAPHDLIQDGIDGIVMKDSFDWDVERLKKVKYWRKSVANNLWSYAKNQSHSWELDTYPSDRRDRNPWDDTGEGNIYGADRPGLGGALELIGQYIVLNFLCNTFEKARHSREGGNPESRATHWIPAFAGMTDDDVAHQRLSTIDGLEK